MSEVREPVGPDAAAERAHQVLRRWAQASSLHASQLRGGERWELPGGTVALWFYPPHGSWEGRVEINLMRLIREGRSEVAERVARELERHGVPLANRDHPWIPCEAIAAHPDEVLDEVLRPYLDAYAELDRAA